MHSGLYFIMMIAGLTSALCYVSVAFAPPPAFLLGYIAPLTILIAGLGWGVVASSGAVLTATLISLLVAGFGTSLFYLIAVGGPAVWLSHLAVLGRPVQPTTLAGPAQAAAYEWYPLGRIVVWAGIFGASALVLTFARINFDIEAYRAPIEAALKELLKGRAGTAGLNGQYSYIVELSDNLAYALPLAAAMAWTAITLLNLWLAALIVRRSGQLPRPWPDLSAIELPRMFLAAFFVLLSVAALLGGAPGYIAAFYASALALIWVLMGLAVVHAITRGRRFRRPLLITLYITLLLFGWPAIPLIILGIVEQIAQLRRRFGRPASPNTPAL